MGFELGEGKLAIAIGIGIGIKGMGTDKLSGIADPGTRRQSAFWILSTDS